MFQMVKLDFCMKSSLFHALFRINGLTLRGSSGCTVVEEKAWSGLLLSIVRVNWLKEPSNYFFPDNVELLLI